MFWLSLIALAAGGYALGKWLEPFGVENEDV